MKRCFVISPIGPVHAAALSRKPTVATLAAATTKKLTLKPSKSKDRKKIVKALKKGKKPKATLEVALADELGNRASTELAVKLKR